jgi:toxin ParE1/3/4
MKIEFLQPAQIEFLEAVVFYNNQSEGLGYEYAAEISRTLERIVRYPDAWPKISKRARRCRTNRFPYGLIYQVRADTILIIAVMHLSRNPEIWKSRLHQN